MDDKKNFLYDKSSVPMEKEMQDNPVKMAPNINNCYSRLKLSQCDFASMLAYWIVPFC